MFTKAPPVVRYGLLKGTDVGGQLPANRFSGARSARGSPPMGEGSCGQCFTHDRTGYGAFVMVRMGDRIKDIAFPLLLSKERTLTQASHEHHRPLWRTTSSPTC